MKTPCHERTGFAGTLQIRLEVIAKVTQDTRDGAAGDHPEAANRRHHHRIVHLTQHEFRGGPGRLVEASLDEHSGEFDRLLGTQPARHTLATGFVSEKL